MIADRLAHQDTRPRALELLLLAHLAIDRTCLRGRARPRVSPAAAIAAAYIEELPAGEPVMAEGFAIVTAGTTERTVRADAIALIEEALALTVEDLAFLARTTVIRMLNAAKTPATLRRIA